MKMLTAMGIIMHNLPDKIIRSCKIMTSFLKRKKIVISRGGIFVMQK